MNKIESSNKTYVALQKGFNLRWPITSEDGAQRIYICSTPEEVQTAANEALSQGFRITVRSGGHCYEGFVSNRLDATEKLAIIDVGEMKGMDHDAAGQVKSPYDKGDHGYQFRIATGNQNWDGYISLYRQAGKTIPGGSCYSVGVGGHVSGGGYGLLSRLHGLTVDWVSGVDILVAAADGKSLQFKHVRADSADETDRMLFTACCGAGGNNFGIIINYYYAELPDAPQQAYWYPLKYDWKWFQDHPENFTKLLQAYWQWFHDNDANSNNPDPAIGNGGLFTLFKLNHIKSDDNIVLAIQYTGIDGLVGGERDKPLNDFIQKMNDAAGKPGVVHDGFLLPNINPLGRRDAGMTLSQADPLMAMDWIYVTQSINGSGNNQRGKYKSEYQIENFSDEVCKALFNNLTNLNDTAMKQSLVQIDSYGGKINANGTGHTAVPQRQSILKAQYQTYWTDPKEDDVQVAWIRRIYNAVHASTGNRPLLPAYQGCYINYPDVDMKYVQDGSTQVDPNWLHLYYQDEALIDRLIALKNKVDPLNLFRHEMSIPLQRPIR
ncbi:BBE domain-containing protein [Aquitalea sp.]|uniref:BBE domain-containing protein n=1 Tax=Aquitalea sp. TaxID=1872623 RepID=UPI00258B0758|nr:BBE domain-containing protein [Aquitalea sp.]